MVSVSSIAAIFVLLSMSALFSGLTLGLMGLDMVGLRIVIESGERPEVSGLAQRGRARTEKQAGELRKESRTGPVSQIAQGARRRLCARCALLRDARDLLRNRPRRKSGGTRGWRRIFSPFGAVATCCYARCSSATSPSTPSFPSSWLTSPRSGVRVLGFRFRCAACAVLRLLLSPACACCAGVSAGPKGSRDARTRAAVARNGACGREDPFGASF
jgi:hypothetical protein